MSEFFCNNELLEKLSSFGFEKEELLEELIANHPELILPSSEKGGVVVIQRQFALSDDDIKNKYALDILMVDKDGVPILVEVKRHTDTRIKREVVAQMLDYACSICREDGFNYSDLQEKCDWNSMPEPFCNEDFWKNKVGSNIANGIVKLVFAADVIPESLRNLIKFLDSSFSKINVYGVEIREYKSSAVSVIEKNNILYEKQTSLNKPTSKHPWNKEEIIDRFNSIKPELTPLFSYALSRLEKDHYIKYGTGSFEASANIWKSRTDSRRLLKFAVTDTSEKIYFIKDFFRPWCSEKELEDNNLISFIFGDRLLSLIPDDLKPMALLENISISFSAFDSEEKLNLLIEKIDELFSRLDK